VRQTVKRNVGVIALEERKLFRIDGKLQGATIDVVFVRNVFRKAIGMLSCGKQRTQYGPLETHVIVKVSHVDNGMFIGNSPGRRYVRRTSRR